MDKQYLAEEFDSFFEFQFEDRSMVSSVSCKMFAEHIAYPISENVAALQDLAIWMAGCGYDFTKHENYMDRRHLLAATEPKL